MCQDVAFLLGAVRTKWTLDVRVLATLILHVKVEPPLVPINLATAWASVEGFSSIEITEPASGHSLRPQGTTWRNVKTSR